jgi:hypothetical protein
MPAVHRCLRLSSGLCLLLHPFVVPLLLTTLTDCCVTSRHTAASHLPAPPPLIAPLPLIVPLLRFLSGWLTRCLSSHGRLSFACPSASHRTATYYRAPPTPLVQPVVASTPATPLPTISLHHRLSLRLLSGWLLCLLLSHRCLRFSSNRRLSLHPSCVS